jgi:hypothetical protein
LDGTVHQFYAFLSDFQMIVDIVVRAVENAKAVRPPQYIPYTAKK